MRHATIFLMATALISLLSQTSAAQIAWESKLRDAHAKAKAEGKLMLLHFYTDNCIYCDRLEAGAFRSDAVCSAIHDNFVPVKVHGAQNAKLAQMFKVTKYPTDVIVTTEGKALIHTVSPQQPDRYINMLVGAKTNFLKANTLLAQTPAATAPVDTAAAAPSPSYANSSTHSAPAGQNLPAGPGLAADSPTSPVEPNLAAANLAAATAPSVSAMGLPAEPQTGLQDTASRVAAGQNAGPQITMPSEIAAASAIPETQTDLPQNNRFVLPPSADTAVTATATAPNFAAPDYAAPDLGGVDASLASARRDPQSMPLPGVTTQPDLAIEGFCPVSVVNKGQWIEGKPELGVVHLGKLYLFADRESMELFLSDPVPFTPMLNEIDVVRFFEEKKIVPGKREWGLIDPVHNRMFFFSDEAAMLHFENFYERYVDASIEVMDYAIEEANPGV